MKVINFGDDLYSVFKSEETDQDEDGMASTTRRRSSRLITADDRFRVSTEELKELMEYRGAEAVKQLQDQYGGVEKLCDMLGTSPTEGI